MDTRGIGLTTAGVTEAVPEIESDNCEFEVVGIGDVILDAQNLNMAVPIVISVHYEDNNIADQVFSVLLGSSNLSASFCLPIDNVACIIPFPTP